MSDSDFQEIPLLELERLETDAARYRWLRAQKKAMQLTDHGFRCTYQFMNFGTPDDLDAAIDAAMLKTPNV